MRELAPAVCREEEEDEGDEDCFQVFRHCRDLTMKMVMKMDDEDEDDSEDKEDDDEDQSLGLCRDLWRYSGR